MYSGGESPLRTIYAKISTTNHQTTENHHMALAKVAGHRGWEMYRPTRTLASVAPRAAVARRALPNHHHPEPPSRDTPPAKAK